MEKRYELKEIESSIDLNDTEKAIVDTKNGNIINYNNACNLLNKQDEKIKEQKKRLQKNIEKTVDMYFERLRELDVEYSIDLDKRLKEIEQLKEENQQLKQSQNNKAIKVLEKIIDFIRNNETVPQYWDIAKFINNIITELKEKK